jgi:Prolyl oligopeptidase family
MKNLLVILFLLVFFTQATAQTYDDQMNKAGEALQKKDFCAALSIFQNAFIDTAKIGTYDFAYAALAATNCQNEKQALVWLKKSQKKGLGLNPGEIGFIEQDSNFITLHAFSEWSEFLNDMKKAFADKQAQEIKRADEWFKDITQNVVLPNKKGQFSKGKAGFALYFTKVDTLQVPYLIYVPKNYDAQKSAKAIVYLHGGIISTEDFNFKNPDIATGEPIFSAGDTFNTIIIYPFGKKDFGWVAQKKAFDNVLSVIDAAQQVYNIDKNQIFLGGMSNGGTATFWFATQKPNKFKGFYAFSANPKLEIGDIDFKQLAQKKPFYSLHAKDDEVFKYDEVNAIYQNQKVVASDWHFETVEKGNHGFIYNPENGKAVMLAILKKMLTDSK